MCVKGPSAKTGAMPGKFAYAHFSNDIELSPRRRLAEVVAMWTGVPVTRIAGEESARLIQMESALHNRIVGQHEAIEAIARAVRRCWELTPCSHSNAPSASRCRPRWRPTSRPKRAGASLVMELSPTGLRHSSPKVWNR